MHIMDLTEFSEQEGLSRPYLRYKISSGVLPATKVLGRWVIDTDDPRVREWVQQYKEHHQEGNGKRVRIAPPVIPYDAAGNRLCTQCGSGGPFPAKGSICTTCEAKRKQAWFARNKERTYKQVKQRTRQEFLNGQKRNTASLLYAKREGRNTDYLTIHKGKVLHHYTGEDLRHAPQSTMIGKTVLDLRGTGFYRYHGKRIERKIAVMEGRG